MKPRTEPLLWIQLLGLAVLPLEALLILLVLAGSDPGPAPLVEEVLCWSLGALAPALVLWRAPADVWSLLLAQIPVRGRRDAQLRLSRLQTTALLKLLGTGLGAGALLVLLIRLDQRAAIAAPLWHLNHLPRLVALLVGALVLSLMLWQWQQALQALWLLGRSEAQLRDTPPLGPEELAQTRLCLGVPLLLPPPLSFATSGNPDGRGTLAVGGQPLPINPEQPTADEQGHQLDDPVG
ncbi:MAG: low-complexity tail membrane protein [Cyanobacteriota bacterium]|nr:low-complexity tail membrane protein [Cyanobacteriota bacterium]